MNCNRPVNHRSDAALADVDDAVKEWFNKGPWREDLEIAPDQSIDMEKFHAHYQENSGLWEKVFEFLVEQDLETLEPGKYDLAGDSLFAKVDRYVTKNEEEALFEAHRKYIDLQYIIEGEERIGVSELKGYEVVEPYDEERDIAFYTLPQNNYRVADNERFFIFFPTDAHRPCVKTDYKKPVKKIVFKILAF